MSRSLSFSTFRSLSRSGEGVEPNEEVPPRPKGELVWMHATSETRMRVLCDVAERLVGVRGDVNVLITHRSGRDGDCACDSGEALITSLPPDLPALARAFLDHWQPDVCLWSGGDLHPSLISTTQERGVGLILADLLIEDLPTRRHRWLPDQSRRIFERFSCILTPSQDVAAQLKRIGVASHRINITSRFSASVHPPSCDEEELSQSIEALGGRPVWLAAHVELTELEVVLNAHETALRMLHRLLLVLAIESPEDLESIREAIKKSGLRVADWEQGDVIDDNVQILLTTSTNDLGLWYRVAPLSLIAGSLATGGSGHDPRPAAALGSAILYGQGVQGHNGVYERMTYAGAAIRVRGEEELAREVIRLTAPDRAAAMALAGWQLVTEGAETTDYLIERIQGFLDTRDAYNAGS
jgi:3-deoxy-D-manno-octulosonic-acid transferase